MRVIPHSRERPFCSKNNLLTIYEDAPGFTKAYDRFSRNIAANISALNVTTDINILESAITRLDLNCKDSLVDLNLSPTDLSLVKICSTQADLLSVSVNTIGESDPLTLREALKSPHREKWILAMREELESLLLNETFDLNPAQSASPTPLSTKWVFRVKAGADGLRYKARLVVRGFMQIEGVDFDETYAPVGMHTTFRMLLALSTMYKWKITQLDVITAFLNPEIDHDNVWVTLPKASIDLVNLNNTPLPLTASSLRLRKALYGLRQSPRLWWKTMDEALLKLGLVRGKYDTNLYFGTKSIIFLYVDDILNIDLEPTNATSETSSIIRQLMSRFKMKNLGKLSRFLGYEISSDEANGVTTVCQHTYIKSIVKRYEVENGKPTYTPGDDKVQLDAYAVLDKSLDDTEKVLYQSIVGALMYAALGTRPDIAYTVSALSRHCCSPLTSHLSAARRVLRYLNTTSDYRLIYSADYISKVPPSDNPTDASHSCELLLRGACDADWASTGGRRSISGYTFYLGNCLISWKAKRQTIVALSTGEAELMACTEACREATWLRNLLIEITSNVMKEMMISTLPVRLSCDNQGALKVINKGCTNPSGRNKHIDMRWYHARDMKEEGIVEFSYVSSKVNVADIMTKCLPNRRHAELIDMLHLKKC